MDLSTNDVKQLHHHRKKGRKRGLNSRAVIRILSSIAKSEPKGMRIWDLTDHEFVGIKDRTTVSKYCTYLAKNNWIRKENKLSPYHITYKVLGDPEIRASLFNRDIIREGMRIELPASLPNKFTKLNINMRKDARDQRIFSDESELFNFSNRIGSLITYACIEAISPYRINEKIAGWDVEEKDLQIPGRDKDKASRLWIRQALNADSIFAEFCKLGIVKRGQAIYSPVRIKTFEAMKGHFGHSVRTEEQKNEAYKKYVQMMKETHRTHRKFNPPHIDEKTGEKKGDPTWSAYEIDAENFKRIKSAFNSVNPHLSKGLTKFKASLKKKILEEREFRKSLEND